MTRVANLTTDNPDFDQLKTLEAEHEQAKVTLTLSPLTEFVLDNLQRKLSAGNRTATVRTLLEAAVLDWLEAKGYSPDAEEFKEKYLAWLREDHLGPEEQVDIDYDTGEPIIGRKLYWNRVAL